MTADLTRLVNCEGWAERGGVRRRKVTGVTQRECSSEVKIELCIPPSQSCSCKPRDEGRVQDNNVWLGDHKAARQSECKREQPEQEWPQTG